MENNNESIKRDDIYFGQVSLINKSRVVYQPKGIYDFENLPTHVALRKFYGREHDITGNLHYSILDNKHRNILFVLDENKFAHDISNNCQPYPVYNISNDQTCLSSNICVTECWKITKVLEHFGFSEQLSKNDIQKVIQTFTGDFIYDNCNLFGVYETGESQSTAWTIDSKGNYRTFNDRRNDSVLPESFFEAFWRAKKSETAWQPLDEEPIIEKTF